MAKRAIDLEVLPVKAPALCVQLIPGPVREYRRVVRTDSDDFGVLHQLPVKESETDAQVLGEIADKFMPHRFWRILDQALLFRRLAVHIGVLKQADGLEAQLTSIPVEVTILNIDPVLTASFHDLTLLGTRTDLLAGTPRFKTSSADMETLVVKYKHIKSGIVWCICFIGLISVAIGAAVGCLTHRVDVGISLSSAVAALVSIIEAVLFWQSK